MSESTKTTYRCVLGFAALLSIGLLVFNTTIIANADGTIVIETSDPNAKTDGYCSLIEAITNANDDAQTYPECPRGNGADTLILQAATTYTLTTINNQFDGANSLPVITSTIIISGNGATLARDTAADTPAFRIFYVSSSGKLTLNNVNIRNGKTSGDNNQPGGGGVYNAGGIVVISASKIISNTASNGGGIENFGILAITNSTIDNNLAQFGGGVLNYDNDYAPGSRGEVTIIASTISNNTAVQSGGGIYNAGDIHSGFGYLRVSNSTVSGNKGDGVVNWGTATIALSTISQNDEVGLYTGYMYASTEISNTLVSGNTLDCDGPLVSGGYNLIQNTSGCEISGNTQGNITGQDPHLGPLANNGGPTLSHALLRASVAINAGDPTFRPPPDYDQRGAEFPRVVGGIVDIGAIEMPLSSTYLPIILK